MKSDPFYNAGVQASPQHPIRVGEFTIGINTPNALKSQFSAGGEVAQDLPPYAASYGYPVSGLQNPRADWINVDGVRSGFVFGYKNETGLWLDFNGNFGHTHDVAILISTQGINALNGKRTDGFRMEKYDTSELPQNYLSTTGAPRGLLWLDGFMAEDGVVRQWVFTEDQSRGVAHNIIGSDAVQAIGVAFFKSRMPKPRPTYRGGTRSLESASLESFGGSTRSMSTKSAHVAAGARINQRVHRDPRDLSYWEPSPSAVAILYYVAESELAGIVGAGRQNEGFLSGMPVGN